MARRRAGDLTADAVLTAGVRVAIYYAPALADPLWQAGSRWLGRDAGAGDNDALADPPGIAAATAIARLYGFHATLQAPARLRPGVGWDTLLDRVARAARACRPFALPRLRVGCIGRYLALLPTGPAPALRTLADSMVVATADLRAPLDEAERARRRITTLSPGQLQMLDRWGYPDVFALWRFHMTLAGPLDDARLTELAGVAQAAFAPACALDRVVRDVCVFIQPGRNLPFHIARRIPLG